MAISTQVTIVGNLVYDPEVRYTSSGKAVVNLTIASTERVMNKETREWGDSEPVFMRAVAWEEVAENIGDSFSKGNRVIAIGTLKADKYTDRNGNEKDTLELRIDEIGASLRYATAKPEKRGRGRNQGGQSEQWAQPADDANTPF